MVPGKVLVCQLHSCEVILSCRPPVFDGPIEIYVKDMKKVDHEGILAQRKDLQKMFEKYGPVGKVKVKSSNDKNYAFIVSIFRIKETSHCMM